MQEQAETSSEQNMTDETITKTTNDEITRAENRIKKEISKLEFYLEQTEKLIQSKDFEEMAIVEQRTAKINETLGDKISNTVELKIELHMTPRNIRQWRNEVKSSYSHLLEQRAKNVDSLRVRQLKIKRNEEMEIIEASGVASIDKWGGYIHIFMFTDRKNNQFEKN